ncbi:MAG: invasion associated locus B family protein [Pseudomonadota bacterium]
MRFSLSWVWAALIAVTMAAPAAATPQRVDAIKDWSVFEVVRDGNKICWVVTRPVESTATRGGKQVEVRRGPIFLMVSVRPSQGVQNEVSFLSGYPFKGGSKVEVSVGNQQFSLFTEGENAWAVSSAEDGQITNAFRRGARARVQGVSQRGTTTRDTFSLSGFTAAIKSAAGRCQ